MEKIFKVGAVILRGRKFMAVREKGEEDYIMPGGRPEGGETAIETLKRELKEELNADVKSFFPMGVLEGPATRKGAWVVQEMFLAEIEGDIRPQSEVEDLKWVGPGARGKTRLSPFIEKVLMPRLVQMDLIG